MTLWLSDEVIRGWQAQGGKGCVYSDFASLSSRLAPELPVPHYSP